MGKLRFVHLISKGDVRQWFDKLKPENGILSIPSIRAFVGGLCRQLSMDEKKAQEQIDELLELVSEFKFHEFVQLVIIITKPAREKKMLELDDELKEDGEEST